MIRALSCIAVLSIAAVPASAQTFVDVFAGRSMPERSDVTLTADEARVNGTVVPARLWVDAADVAATDSTIYGVRVGHWFDVFGIALDVSTLDPDVRRQTVRATANLAVDEEVFGERVHIDPGRDVAVDLPRIGIPTTATVAGLFMLRAPVGRVAPYAYGGPAYLVTDSDMSGNWGVRAGGGVSVDLTRRMGLFAEYRYTGVRAQAVAGRIGGKVRGVEGDSGDIRVDLRVRSHSAAGGVRFTF